MTTRGKRAKKVEKTEEELYLEKVREIASEMLSFTVTQDAYDTLARNLREDDVPLAKLDQEVVLGMIETLDLPLAEDDDDE